MLIDLEIATFKLLDKVHLTFGSGMTVITGETGVGKSMLLGAIGFLFGDKAGDEVFPADSQEVRVAGSFALDPKRPEVARLIEAGLWDPADDPEFVLERILARGGRSRFFLNGRRLTQAAAMTVGEALLDVLGQHQVRYLTQLDPLDLLDQYGDRRHRTLAARMADAYRAYREASRKLKAATDAQAQLAERRAFLEYQQQELAKAHLLKDEETQLEAEHQRLANVSDLRTLASEASTYLVEAAEGSSAAYDLMAEGQDRLDALAALDPAWEEPRKELAGTMSTVQELGRSLAIYGDELEDDPQRLAQVERRIQELESLKRKYRTDYAGLLALQRSVESQLLELEAGGSIETLQEEATKLQTAALGVAHELHASRNTLAPKVAAAVKGHLGDLNLGQAKVAFEVAEDSTQLHAGGIDKVELLLSTHPREPLQPFRTIASGGEVTRLALAFKALQASHRALSILVIDEGDLGIGGDTGFRVGAKFRDLSQHQQVFVVSHLPQVAAFADQHLAIAKHARTGRITIQPVDGDTRVIELARMLGQSTDPAAARELASSYLKQALPV